MMQTAIKCETEVDPATINDVHERPDQEREQLNRLTVLESEIDEDPAALHDDVQVKHERANHEREKLNMQIVVKCETEEDPAALYDVQVKHERPDREGEELNVQIVVKCETEEDPAALYDDVQVKHERPCREREESNMQIVVKCETEDNDVQVKHEHSDCKREIALNKLYAEHEVEEELVTGPVMLQKPGPSVEKLFRDAPLPKRPRLKNNSFGQDKPPEKENDDSVTEENISETLTPEASVDVQSTESAEYKQLIAKSKAFTCNDCQKRFKLKHKLLQHIKTHNKNISELYLNCTECEYKTATRDTLDKHLKLHDRQRKHACEMCSFRFETKRALRSHIRERHTVNKKITCEICGKFKTNRLSILEEHLRIHSGEKPFSCTQCPYKCTTQSDLKKHFRTHTGEKPFSCPHCQYNCTRQNNLKAHMRTHTDEKPFTCPQCQYKFAQRSVLKRHILRKHNNC